MVRQSFSWFDSTTTSSQSSLENLQTNQNLHNDTDGICVLSGHGLKMDKFEYQEIGHVYHDPIVVYMEELFFSECPLIPKVSVIVHSPRALCCEDQVGNQSMFPMQVLFLILVKNSEREELLEQLLDWMHWHYCII
jgi:hypothetical protein